MLLSPDDRQELHDALVARAAARVDRVRRARTARGRFRSETQRAREAVQDRRSDAHAYVPDRWGGQDWEGRSPCRCGLPEANRRHWVLSLVPDYAPSAADPDMPGQLMLPVGRDAPEPRAETPDHSHTVTANLAQMEES